MKAKQPLRRHVVNDIPKTAITSKTKNNVTSSHLLLVCPVCETTFTRKAAEAKRHAVSYCGKACAGFACRNQVNVKCKVCDNLFSVKKSSVGRVTCCGDDCRKKAMSECTTAMDIAGWKNGMFQGGEKSSGSKITECQAKLILIDERKHSDIAKDYGITRAAVSHLKRGKTWAYLQIDKTKLH